MTADDLTRDRTGRSATSSLDPEGNEARLLHKLNPREHQVLAALVEGLQSKEIAPLIGATPKRVDKIVERVREKLDAPTRLAAARRYRDLIEGGISPGQPFPLPTEGGNRPTGPGVPADAVYTLADAATFAADPPWARPQPSSAPEFWVLRLGALPRAVLIVAGAVGLLMLAALGLSLAQGLSQLVAG